jgi:hypothetical protein
MITKYKKDRSLIFDGPEADILEMSFHLDDGPLDGQAIKLQDFAANDFENLKEVIGDEHFEFILETGAFLPDEGFLNHYKSENRLKLYYIKKGNSIAVFSYGEFQPTRYQLYLEGIWTVD